MTKEDKQQYAKEYYEKTKGERAHEYALVSKRSYLRKQIAEVGDTNSDKVATIQAKIEAIDTELNAIRDARWKAKREAGGALFKKFPEKQISTESTTIE